jgi:deazaflavin-dependent oxidoreductase (nitroreductase family)
MPRVRKKGVLWHLFRAPVYLYRWRLGWLLGHRCLLLTHIGRRSGLRYQTVLEVIEFRKEESEVVVANGFGPNSDWVCNIEAGPGEEVTIGLRHFEASHRFLGEEEAVRVIERYEWRNRFIAPIVRDGFSWLLGWPYRGSHGDRRRLVRQLPLIAFRPTSPAGLRPREISGYPKHSVTSRRLPCLRRLAACPTGIAPVAVVPVPCGLDRFRRRGRVEPYVCACFEWACRREVNVPFPMM